METAQDPPPRKNMRTGLIIFGSLSIVFGVLCLLMVPLMFVGNLIPVKGHEPTPFSLLFPAALFYLAIAVADIWLGVGSIQCKRWARSLLLLCGIFWLLSGVLTLLSFSLTSGQMDAAFAQSENPMPPGFAAGFKIGMFLFVGFFEVILPGAFVWFYSLRDTRLTCEERHPFPAWTDRCPLSVLALTLWAGTCALTLPFMLIWASAIPLFGIYVKGLFAALMLLVLCLLWGWIAWGIYHLKKSAWWLNLGLMILMMASYMVTMSQGGLMEMYHHMNLPAQTMKLLETNPLFKSHWIALVGFLFIVPYAGLMLYVRKYFISEKPGN